MSSRCWRGTRSPTTPSTRCARSRRSDVGALTDALIDPNQPFAVRRRLARVFSICVSQRAVDGLLLALDDVRFEVRFHCGRSLSRILAKNPLVRINRERIFDVVRAEVTVGRPVWEGHRLLDAMADDKASFVDDFVKDRASQSLAHVFALLSLVLPFEPLQIAYRGLHTTIRRSAAPRSSISRACCRRTSATGCGHFSARVSRSTSERAAARRSLPTCCARMIPSC